ncbi:MAG: hypothetical protein QOC63_6076 [Mycobacterium sp.]|nr:hypothetical protein [Mycobacterium sp.]
MNGPSCERLFAAIEKEAGIAKPLLTLTIGTKRYTGQYESILRPVFKDDEMLMVSVGAVLGFFVGELQVFFVEHFAR